MSDNDDIWEELLSVWWGKLLMAIVFFGIAWLLYAGFTQYENGEGSGRVPWIFALAYYVGGKWVVTGVFALLGTLFAIWGVRQGLSGQE